MWNYYRQSGPIYGEVSAPKRWEDTIAPWVSNEVKMRGGASIMKAGAYSYCCTSMTASLMATQLTVKWIFFEVEERFKCKSAGMVTNLITQD